MPGWLLAASMTLASAGSPSPRGVTCSLHVTPRVVADGPAWLAVTLRNRGARTVRVLTWGTPFEEAWLAPFVTVTRDGTPLAYGGATVKRGDPTRDEYLRLAPGQARSARLDLAEVFDLSVPGSYRIEPALVLHDVVPAGQAWPRPRARHAPVDPGCRGVTLRLPAGRAP